MLSLRRVVVRTNETATETRGRVGGQARSSEVDRGGLSFSLTRTYTYTPVLPANTLCPAATEDFLQPWSFYAARRKALCFAGVLFSMRLSRR